MKYALVNTQRLEAKPGQSGKCPVCGSPVLAKCGEHRVWHWAHRATRRCDSYWEPETEWHRDWKNCFPAEWQEVVQFAESGEKHIADVKTKHGLTIEFQHSYLPAEERRSREDFYGRMVWVVGGLRRKRDMPRFDEALSGCRVLMRNPLMVLVPAIEGALLRDWADSRVPVFFDFGVPSLWWLDPKSPAGWARLMPAMRENLVMSFLRGNSFEGIDCSKTAKPSQALSVPVLHQTSRRLSRRPLSFRQYMARKRMARSRRRL